MLNCSLQDQMLGFDVPSGSQFTSPSIMGEPRLAYTQNLTSALSENITIKELQEFVSYVFSVAVETSAGRSLSVDGCFMTTPTGEIFRLSLFLFLSLSLTFHKNYSHHTHLLQYFSSWSSNSSILHNYLQYQCHSVLGDAATRTTQWYLG